VLIYRYRKAVHLAAFDGKDAGDPKPFFAELTAAGWCQLGHSA